VRRDEDPWYAVSPWLDPRDPVDASRELLSAAGGASTAARVGATDVVVGLGEEVLAAWREVEHIPRLGPHARAALVDWDQLPHLEPVDAWWLATEHAAAALEGPGPDEALSTVYERVPGKDAQTRLAAMADSGHPEADRVVRTLTDFVSSGVPRSVDQVFQLKVILTYSRPPIWRRVLVPATAVLGELHSVIQVLFGWDGDHLHAFTVGAKQYSDPLYLHDLDMGDEFAVRLRDVFTGTTKKIRYEYDFGASWRHEIVLEKVREREPGAAYPVCVAFAGGSPVEYPDEDDPEEPKPFDLAKTNGRLARHNEEAQ
jgi:hypothetical protein